MIFKRLFVICICVSLIHYVRSQTFMAGVYEHKSVMVNGNTPQETVMKNTAVFQKAIENAAKLNVDILVFPENGLLPESVDRKVGIMIGETVPDPSKGSWNPCIKESHNTPVLRNFSCSARKHSMYLLINYIDIQPCSKSLDDNCPDDDVFVFNANIVFNRQGEIVSRYHKRHLYKEGRDAPAKFEYVSFKTEFGTVSMFTCFDIQFKEAVEVVERSGCRILLYPTNWIDELPFMPAVVAQQAFAVRMNVTLLASNLHSMNNSGISGSGVYQGERGAINYTMSEDDVPKLLVTKVPPDFDSDGNRFHEDIPPHSSYKPLDNPMMSKMKMIKLENPEDTITSCHNGMCCRLTYSLAEVSFIEDYYFLVFNGTSSHDDKYKWCTELSLLTRCEPDNQGNPCRHFRYVSRTKFRKAEISCSFSTSYVFPIFFTSGIGLPPKDNWNFQYTPDSAKIESENFSDKSLVSFGLHGRCFERDPPFVN